MRDINISVSILNMDFANLAKAVRNIEKAGIDSFHMDIMDGSFVDNISFGPAVVETVKRITSLPLISHLMILKPFKYVDRFFAAGSEKVIVHAEALNKEDSRLMDRENMGVSINPDIPLESVYPYLEKADRVLVMSVFAGFGEQEFIPQTVDRISALREKREELGLKFVISVDGGINDKNAAKCVRAGADELVVGSYATRSKNPVKTIKRMREALRD
jgi:ribulose-phosphate 3-epimerase